MSPQDIRRAARWLQQQALAQATRDAALHLARLSDRTARRARVADQPRDDKGRWTKPA